MTVPEITAYVMALSVEDVRRLTATEIMGWVQRDNWWDTPEGVHRVYIALWRPDIDRNQSRQVTDKVKQYARDGILGGVGGYWYSTIPLDESRAALIAHMIHAEETAKNG